MPRSRTRDELLRRFAHCDVRRLDVRPTVDPRERVCPPVLRGYKTGEARTGDPTVWAADLGAVARLAVASPAVVSAARLPVLHLDAFRHPSTVRLAHGASPLWAMPPAVRAAR